MECSLQCCKMLFDNAYVRQMYTYINIHWEIMLCSRPLAYLASLALGVLGQSGATFTVCITWLQQFM